MLTQEENELVCRVGPGTPMGVMMRRFWIPACLSSDLPKPDGDPLRIRLLGENFVAFRDSNGKAGILNELCTHRGASLALGRVEDHGLRCLYHGWKFAVDGTILDTPNNPDPSFKERFKAPAYPVREDAGFIWVYLGPREKEPPFPRFQFMDLPESQRTVVRIKIDCNYLQLLEGGLDSSHVGILHIGTVRALRGDSALFEKRANFSADDNAPRLEIEDTDFGFHYAALRKMSTQDGDAYNVRVTPFIMPFGRVIPPGIFHIFEVPMDDTHTSTYIVFMDQKQPVDRAKVLDLLGLDDSRFWANDEFQASWGNRFFQDRAAMKTGATWTGLRGLEQEDGTIVLSMGALFDRSIEHVVPADRAVMHVRRVLIDSARKAARGEDPRGVAITSPERIEAPEGTMAADGRWQELAPGHVPL